MRRFAAARSPLGHKQPTRLPPCVTCSPSHKQVLERALRQAGSQFNTDNSNPTVGFVRLSGALHCEERAAFQEIAHQLCRCAHALCCKLLARHRATRAAALPPVAPVFPVNTPDRPRALIACLLHNHHPPPLLAVARSTSPSAAAPALMTTWPSSKRCWLSCTGGWLCNRHPALHRRPTVGLCAVGLCLGAVCVRWQHSVNRPACSLLGKGGWFVSYCFCCCADGAHVPAGRSRRLCL